MTERAALRQLRSLITTQHTALRRRAELVGELRAGGWTLEAIGREFGVTRQTVHYWQKGRQT